MQIRHKFKSLVPVILILCFLNVPAFAQIEGRLTNESVLKGKTGVATPASVDSVSINPAQAAFLRRSEAQIGWGLMSYDYKQRYAGFKTHNDSKTGLDGPAPIPKFVYKRNARWGFGGLIIPFPLKQKFNVTEMPIVILNQENMVDLVGEGSLNGYANINAGYLVNRDLAFGANLTYLAYSGKGRLTTSATGAEIAAFEVSATTIKLGMGVKYNYDVWVFGLSTALYSQEKTDTKFDASIKTEDSEKDTGDSATFSEFLNPIRVGVGVDIPKKLSASAEVEYKRASKGKTRYSVVDFSTKDVDLYDTWSLYLGSETRLAPRYDLLLGAFYEPSAIGPGKKGDDEKTGFGFLDVAENLGEPPAKPVWLIAGGGRYHFGPKLNESKKKTFSASSYRMALEFGLAYSETSIGIDKTGEQPGAYLVRKVKLPIVFKYKF